MPIKVTFELSDRDLRHFRREMTAVIERLGDIDEKVVLDHTAKLVPEVPKDAPEFIRERIEKLEALVKMLRDEDWCLEGRDRTRVVKALTYFAEPHDLIPDTIPGIGFLDDAIMVELVCRDLRHEIEAYADFCRYRSQKDKLLGKSESDPTHRAEWLVARRSQLQTRMRRRRRTARSRRGSGGPSQSILRLW